MSTSSTQLQQLAVRLGVFSQPLLRKAAEFERLLKLKLSGTNKINDSAQAIVCLDLAAQQLCLQFDSETAVQLAAVKKSVYSNYKHTVVKLLNLTDSIDVNGLCVQLGCTNVGELATNIFDYCQKNIVKTCDWTHPQFVCMSVYQACKIEKIKISKSKFLSNSRLKLAQWNELDVIWTKILSTSPFINKSIANRNIERKSNAIIVSPDKKCDEEIEKASQVCVQNEDYETWKRRILREACEEIENIDADTILKNVKSQSQGVVLTF